MRPFVGVFRVAIYHDIWFAQVLVLYLFLKDHKLDKNVKF